MIHTNSLIVAGIPTVAVIAAFFRNEFGMKTLGDRIGSLEMRITSLESWLDLRIETLDRDLREWAKITMQHNSDIAVLKERDRR